MVSTSMSFDMLGTHVVLQITHPEADSILNQAFKILEDLERRFNANNNQSELMKINKQAGIKPVKVNSDLFKLIKIGKMYSIASLLNLNIAIGPLVRLWQVGAKEARKPSMESIDACLKLISPQNIQLNDRTQSVYLQEEKMEIDLGAIAKGYFSDILKEFFVSHGVKDGKIDLGGNVQVFGNCPDEPDGNWLIDIPGFDKHSKNKLGRIKLNDESIVTTNIYEECFQANGQFYHRILDSRTGYPINTQISSLSIISTSALDCEIWTTILYYGSHKEAIGHINNTPGIEGIVVDLDGNIHLSAGIHHRFTADLQSQY